MSPKTTPSAPSVSAAAPPAWTTSRWCSCPSPGACSVEEGEDIVKRCAFRDALLLARRSEVQQGDAALAVGDLQGGAAGGLAQDRGRAPASGASGPPAAE